MLSTAMRQRVEFICQRIASGAPVELSDMAWLQKLADRNPTVASWLRQARRKSMEDENTTELDQFCNTLDIGEPDPSDHLVGPQNPVTIAEWFQDKQRWFRGSS